LDFSTVRNLAGAADPARCGRDALKEIAAVARHDLSKAVDRIHDPLNGAVQLTLRLGSRQNNDARLPPPSSIIEEGDLRGPYEAPCLAILPLSITPGQIEQN
jgi:hypothetical protein